MKNNRETLYRDIELKEFQKEMTEIIRTQREKGEQADFDGKIDTNELTPIDMGMYRHIQELEEKGFDIDSVEKLKKEMTFIRRYKNEVQTSKNNSRDVYIQWIVNRAHAMCMQIEDAILKLPKFKEQMKKLIQDELRKKRLKKEYEQSFNDPLDVDELLPSDMRVYEWIQALKNIRSEDIIDNAQENFDAYRERYFKYSNNVTKSNVSRRAFVHYVGNLVTLILSNLELRVMYPEDFQKIQEDKKEKEASS